MRIVQGFPYLGAEPRVMGFGGGGQAGRQPALRGNAGQEHAHGIRERQPDASQRVGRFGLELIVHADMEHRRLSGHWAFLHLPTI